MEHAETLEWAMKALKQTEMNIEVVVETPWSNILKISLPQGLISLKQTTPDLFIEEDVIQVCRDLCKITDTPEGVAREKSLHYFLMKEFGNASLRTVFDGHLNVDLLVQGLQIYRKMQEVTVLQIDAFLEVGIPD